MSLQHARALRSEMTKAEHKLWRALRDRRLGHVKFRRQAPVGPYVADFLSKRHRLVVEIDGGQHGGLKDHVRDRRLAALGYRTLRIWNVDVLTNLEGVLWTIAAALKRQEVFYQLTPEPPPHPPIANAMGPSLSPLGRGAVLAGGPLHQRIEAPLSRAPLPLAGG